MSGTVPSFGTWGSGKQRTKYSLSLVPRGGETFGEKKKFLFLRSSDVLPPQSLPSHQPWGQELPCNDPESPSASRRGEPGPRAAAGDPASLWCPLAQNWAPPARTNGCQRGHCRRPDGRCLGQGQVPWESLYSNCK